MSGGGRRGRDGDTTAFWKCSERREEEMSMKKRGRRRRKCKEGSKMLIIVVSAQRQQDMCLSGHLLPTAGTPTPNKGKDAMTPATSPSQRF